MKLQRDVVVGQPSHPDVTVGLIELQRLPGSKETLLSVQRLEEYSAGSDRRDATDYGPISVGRLIDTEQLELRDWEQRTERGSRLRWRQVDEHFFRVRFQHDRRGC